MFSSRAPKLIGAALMDLAEAMLRPVDADSDEHAVEAHPGSSPRRRSTGASSTIGGTAGHRAAAGDDWLLEQLFTGDFAARPGREPARSRAQRAARRIEPTLPRLDRARRPGTIERPEQPCVSPLPSRTPGRGLHAA